MHKFKTLFIGFYILLCTGFTLGTLTLSIIVESLVQYIRRTGELEHFEDIIVIFIIFILAFYTLILSRSFYRSYQKAKPRGRIIWLFVLTALFACSLWYWFHPKSGAVNETYMTSKDGRFVVGPYPDMEKMHYLKNHGYTAIISLLSPYVVPFEPILMRDEKHMADQVGVPIINIPMLPWVSQNAASIAKIKALASQSLPGKYYVHCYYGRDRASMFLRVVNLVNPVNVHDQVQMTHQNDPDSITTLPFERGTAYMINQHVIFGPQPTEDELTLYVMNLNQAPTHTPIQTVISLQPIEQTPLPSEAKLKDFGIQYRVITPDDYPYDPGKFLALAQELKATQDGILVFANYASPTPMPAALEGTLYAYLTNLPSLPYSKFKSIKMTNGHAELIAPNILMGPHPTEDEYQQYLFYWGIRRIAYLGACQGADYEAELQNAQHANLPLYCMEADNKNLEATLAQEGPWYVYGPEKESVEEHLESHFRKSIPRLP